MPKKIGFMDQFRKIRREISHRIHLTRSREFNLLVEYLELKPGDRVCDLGSGDGYWTSRFALLTGARAAGIDPELAEVERARHYYGERVDFFNGFAESLPFEDCSFEKVVGICAMEHFSDDHMALLEMRRVLVDDGLVALSLDSLSLPGINETYKQQHSRRFSVNNYYTHQNVKAKLEKAGLKLLKYQYIGCSEVTDTIIRTQLLLGSKLKYLGMAMSIFYPLVAIIERLTRKDAGHILVIQACKMPVGI